MLFNEPFGGLVPGARGATLAVLLQTGKPMTGRKISEMVGEGHSLWAVQAALNDLVTMGLVEAERYGRSTLHRVNQKHAMVPMLRAMSDPVEILERVVKSVCGDVDAVILFGSTARGEAGPRSDVDLAVIAPQDWDGALALQEAIWDGLGNDCDVLTFTAEEFLAKALIEPVVQDILRDGVPLVGEFPRRRQVA